MLDAYVESVMLHELSLRRTIQRLENRLAVILTTTSSSDQSASSSSDAFKKALELLRIWKAGAIVAGSFAAALGIACAVLAATR